MVVNGQNAGMQDSGLSQDGHPAEGLILTKLDWAAPAQR